MATEVKSENPPSPTNDESDAEDQVDEEQEESAPNDNVSRILQQLKSSGALIKKPKQEFHCKTCDETFRDWDELENHLIQHVSLPAVVLDKLPSDDELEPPSDDDWSEDEGPPAVAPVGIKTTPQKVDISQILKKTGLQIKKPIENASGSANSALDRLSGLGFTIKKNSTPIKEEKSESQSPSKNNDILQKLGQLGGLKLKLKSDGDNTNSFKVVNGLKDFNPSDDEEGSDEEQDKDKAAENEQDKGDSDNESGDEQINRKNSDSDESFDKVPLAACKNMKVQNVPVPKVIPKVEPIKLSTSGPTVIRRPNVKQTPKRGANMPIAPKIQEIPQTNEKSNETNKSKPNSVSSNRSSTEISNRSSTETNNENVTVKKEVESDSTTQSNSDLPLFSSSNQIKTERSSPTPCDTTTSTPIISQVKTETDPTPTPTNALPLFTTQTSTANLLPVTKQEDTGVTIIEINGDSNDEDDDCCVVSATPAPDVKPVIPKTESAASYSLPASYPSASSNYPSAADSSRISSAPHMEKQHSFNWNAPDSKPPIDMLERSADDIFESLLSSATKKENNLSMGDSEYISLDTLGPQQSCDICNTRFTSMQMLEDHIRMTGHSRSIVTPSSSTLMPYNPSSSSILSSLLPVKHLAEQVGKLSTIGGSSSSGFTHQQNVMINIQAYPGAGGILAPPQNPYTQYSQQGQNMSPGYGQPTNNMYGTPGTVPGQYPGQYLGQQQQQQPFGQQYPGQMSQTLYSQDQSPYGSTASPLQSMQQAVYGTANMMTSQPSQMGQMGPPQYVPSSSAGGAMKSPMGPPQSTSGIRIQNVQTFQPGQLIGPNGQPVTPGQVTSAQSPGQLRMGSPNIAPRPRMPGNVRGARPSIRPGIQVQGQVHGRGGGGPRPRLKRPGGAPAGPPQKRRPDMLLPGKHDNEDCQVMAMQKQREGMPMIHSVQGAKDKLNLGSQISITKKVVNKEANAMANVLASRGISIKQKQKSRSPSPERPVPHIPNLGSGVSIKHTSKSSNFSIPEAKVGGSGHACRICKKMFMSSSSLSVHMMSAHPQSKINLYKCDECPASYPKSLQLQHHKRVFHNVSGANRELGLPVVDMSQEDNLKKLSNLGIYSFIPLANREQPGGCYGIPVISVNNMQNGMSSSLQALGADGLLSLGPLKPLPNT